MENFPSDRNQNVQQNTETPQASWEPPVAGEGIDDHRGLYTPTLIGKIVLYETLNPTQRATPDIADKGPDEYTRLIHNPNPSRKEKKKVWKAEIQEGVERPSDPKTDEKIGSRQYAVKGFRDEVVAMRIAKRAKKTAHHNAEHSLFESGIYEINPETGLSKLRQPPKGDDDKGSLNHLSWGMRKRVEKAEKRFTKLSRHSAH